MLEAEDVGAVLLQYLDALIVGQRATNSLTVTQSGNRSSSPLRAQ